MRKWFKKKNVAVVGNATSLFDTMYGADIDEHDVVVRINLGYRAMGRPSHGHRLDVLACSRYSFLVRNGVINDIAPGAVLQTGELNHGESMVDGLCYVDEKTRQALKDLAGLDKKQKPSAGLATLWWIRQCGAAQVDVYGFDWKQTPTFYDPNVLDDTHAYDLERGFCLGYFRDRRGFRFY
jgi:hypothetical protein